MGETVPVQGRQEESVYDTIASGDSHNDLGMIQASKAGFLFKSTDAIKSEYPEIPAYETYDELYDAIRKVIKG